MRDWAADQRYLDAMAALAIRAGSRRLDDLGLRACRELAAAGVPCLVMRGPAVAHALYDAPEERAYGDIDVLVPYAQVATAKGVLDAMDLRPVLEGSARSELSPHATAYVGEAGSIDLHWTLRGVRADPRGVWDALAPGAGEIELGAGTVAVPRPAVLAMTVALHAAQHGPQGPVQREDVRRAAVRLPQETWREAVQLADRLGAANWLASGLGESAEGRRVMDGLGLELRPELELEIRAEGDQPMIRGISDFNETRGVRNKLRLLLRELFPSPAFMRRWSPAAHRPLGLVLAYLVRPFWLAWRLPSALVSYRRARRRAGGG